MRFRNLNFDTKRVILYLEKHKKPKNGGKCKKMSKFTTFLFFVSAAAAVLLCGCRSDRYYQARAAERARAYLLENAPELDPQQCSFVRYNDNEFILVVVNRSENKYILESDAIIKNCDTDRRINTINALSSYILKCEKDFKAVSIKFNQKQ